MFGTELCFFRFANQKFKDYGLQNYNFPCYLYGSETWSLTLREVRRLRMFKNSVLSRILWSNRDEVAGE
jgi:hypothetical protein